MATKNAELEPSEEQFPIRELSARTQVNTVTIRAWERRYGLLKPKRTAKGHRLYTGDDVRHVESILTLVARGVPLSKIKSLLDQGQSAREVEANIDDNSWEEPVNELIKYARQFSSTRIEALLSNMLIQYPPNLCLENLLKPTFEALQGDSDHLASWTFTESEILRYVLLRLGAKKSPKGKPAITLSRGDKAPLWRMAVIALELADADFRVQLISQSLQEKTWLAMAKVKTDTIHVFYQDGLWRDECATDIASAQVDDKKLIVCGTAPVVSGLKTPHQVFPDLEKYASFQLGQEK
jgi:DNA-binding transcriptional MerR regulator